MSFHCQIKALLPYSKAETMNIALDFHSYPDFLTGYRDVEIIEQRGNICIVKSYVGLGSITKSFTTKNIAHRDGVDIQYIEGPFEDLDSYWRFKEINVQTTEVEFFIEMFFKNRIVEKMATPILSKQIEPSLHQFNQRAASIYGYRDGFRLIS